jgi:hypothetical protein
VNSRLLLSCGRCCFSCGSGVIPPRSRKGVASTATLGKVVVAVAIAITIVVIAVVMNTFLYSFQMNTSIKYIKEYILKNRHLLRNLLKFDVFG